MLGKDAISQNAKSSRKKTSKNNQKLKVVDFFCGGGGMSYGMQLAGLKVLAGIDYEPACKETYEANIKGAEFIQADVFELKEKELQQQLGLKKNDKDLVLIGCSPCQFWSIINTDKRKSQKSKNLLVEFQRFVKYFKPGYVVVENVPGVLRNKEESGLQDFINWLEISKYKVHFDVHNVNDYGVAQNRKRFTLVANRVTKEEIFPVKRTEKRIVVKDVLGVTNGFPRISHGNRDNTDFLHTTSRLGELNQERLKYVRKDGGDRFGFADKEHLQLKCFVGRDNSFRDTFGRLWWNKPSPTITTKFCNISNGRFVHPDEDRALSLREGAVLQSFPKDYIFKGTAVDSIARLIGNAVPPEYAKSIGVAIKNNSNAI
ncbi:DNA cytosine methyltransferase [Pedobacter nyackensis]|uniref:DNA (cytosine-5-)-methyltransferase n=1 Tax=Pedobacter nyackensis TaxID=475255 RepID=A0A1W2EF60_9SPHI|nr:DNA cytosine methyltransferase [Pedobacter nyackensis]SMD08359.1 DNA (cytosine-5)-methyltransferase 1 [Pedobacter nyackensis]